MGNIQGFLLKNITRFYTKENFEVLKIKGCITVWRVGCDLFAFVVNFELRDITVMELSY